MSPRERRGISMAELFRLAIERELSAVAQQKARRPRAAGKGAR
jgi:hypothetical protein